MQRVLGFTILSLGVILPSVAPAQAPPQPVKAEAQYVKRVDFNENEEVVGTMVRPDGEMVTGGGKARHRSLVRPRQSFIPELIKSAREL